ncbi:hypothetical protein ACFOW6_00390 [Fodinicurvata halophila]|uniref:Uncharacterized protein n=1 Tax=Fodinicurvata halophila TaxID=1419723 RepID=A0ABV8UGN6_9PROT
MQDDIRQRDLSGKTVSQMSEEERKELKRRMKEFVGAMRQTSRQHPAEKNGSEEQTRRQRRWNPGRDGQVRKRG